MPDIDVDFCERRRGEVIEYVTRKYGRENVSQIITFGTMKAKAVIRDVGRVLDLPYADVDRIAKQIPPALDMTLEKALAENPVLREMRDKIRASRTCSVRAAPRGMSRAGVHAAGVVIAPGPITDYAPLYKSNRDEITTVGDEGGRTVGLLKMDFLGLARSRSSGRPGGSSTGRRARHRRRASTIPGHQVFCDGQTFSIFQFESSGMRELLRKSKPQRLDDLIALNALSPGPLKSSGFDYVARKRARPEKCASPRSSRSSPTPTASSPTGTGDADRGGARQLHPRAVGRAAQAMGKKDPRSWPSRRAPGGTEGHQARKIRDLRTDGYSQATASTSRTRPPAFSPIRQPI
jgi:DNA polymerase-3 subunit alpha